MEFVLSLVISLFITAVAYLIVPIIFCIIGYKTYRSYSIKTIRKIVIINGACVWLLFQIISISAGETDASPAVFLWSAVAYWLMKKFLVINTAEDKEPIQQQTDNDHTDLVVLTQYFLNKEKKYKIAIVVISVLLVLSLGLNLYQAGLTAEYETNAEKSEFIDEFVVFIEDDNTNLYHKYECNRFKGDYFWAFNIDQAISMGYKPCPICCKE